MWRNAAQHRDEERWRRDGPCSAAKLSRHLAELGEREALGPRERVIGAAVLLVIE